MTDNPRRPSFSLRVPDDDTLEREVCDHCGFINYANPVIVVGAVCTWEDRYMLCTRAIEPRSGFWTMPAGYLEQNESPADGARRETREEACAEIEIDALLGVYAIPPISQVQLVYRGVVRDGVFAPGAESRDVKLFDWDEIPWDDLAFPSVRWALQHHRAARGMDAFAPFVSPFDREKT